MRRAISKRGIVQLFVPAAVLACASTALAVAQLTFEAASVKAVKLSSHPVFGNHGGPGTSDPTRVHLCCVGMYSLIMRAYDVELDQIVGPSWIMDNMGANLYEVDATMPPETTKAQFQVMMQNLLAQRFHVEVHRQTRTFPGYELVVAKGGPKFKESADQAPAESRDAPETLKRGADGRIVLPPGPQMLISLGEGMVRVRFQQKPVADLVKGMGRLIADSMGESPGDFASPKPRVIDKTGLTGIYDFTLEFACEGCASLSGIVSVNGGAPAPAVAADTSGATLPNIFVALEKQLGLKLVRTKNIPLDLIVIDHADKIPTAN